MKDKFFVVKVSVLVVLCILVGGILITLANYLPVNANIKQESLGLLMAEGEFPEIPSLRGEDGDFHSMKPTTLELATDELMLHMALYEGEGEGIEQAFLCYSTHPYYETEYSRYWHGYVVILRLLFLVFNYYEIRILNMLCQTMIVSAIAFLLWKQKGLKYVLAIGTSYLLLMPPALSFCLQYTWVFYGAFVPLLIYIKNKDLMEQGNRYFYFFLIVGAVTSYLDLLTYPLLTWGLLIVWWIILDDSLQTSFDNVKKVVLSGVAWILGYSTMWVGKWALGSLVLQQNLFEKAIEEAKLWTVNEGDNAITLKDRLEAVFLNWSMYDYKIYLIVLLAWLLYWIVKGGMYGSKKSRKALALLLVFCASFVWFVVLAGHVLMHHIFTHRTFAVSIAAFLGIVLISTKKKDEGAISINRILRRVLVLAVIAVVSVSLMLQIKEDYSHHNGGTTFQEVQMGDKAIMTFVPEYSTITKLKLGFSVGDNAQGSCILKIMSGETIIETEELILEEYTSGNFHELDVEWKLKAGYPYTFILEKGENSTPVTLYISENGERILSEFNDTIVGDANYEGQILSGISYWCILTDDSQRILFTGSYMAILLMLVYACYSMTKIRK